VPSLLEFFIFQPVQIDLLVFIDTLSNWRETHDTYSQNGQWSCSQIGHLVKMVNVITTYLPNYYDLFTYLPTKPTYLPTYLLIITYVLTYLPTHPHNNCLLQPT
jgi:hypothetical protein